MDLLQHLALGLGVAVTLQNLGCAFLGAVLGTLIRVLPGLGPVATITTIAMLLPFTRTLDATPALILLAGIYYGAQWRSSFWVACVGTLIVAALAPPLTALVAHFGPADDFSLLLLGLIGAVVLAPGSLLKAIAMMVLGLLLAQIHTDLPDITDVISITPRLRFDIAELSGGVSFVAVAIGVFGIGEIVTRLGQPAQPREAVLNDGKGLWPTVLRGTALGSVLTLGIAPNAAMALLMAAMTIKGIPPGPQVIASHAPLFWGLIASMWVGSAMLLVLQRVQQRALIGTWMRRLTLPHRFLFPVVTLFACIGVYTLHHRSFELYLTAGSGLVGYLFHKLNCEAAPLLLGFILGPRLEVQLRHALALSGGDWSAFITSPLSAALLGAAVLMIVLVMLPAMLRKRAAAFQE